MASWAETTNSGAETINSGTQITNNCAEITNGCAETINIWAETNVEADVSLTAFPTVGDDATGIGVIICPGGSYFWHDHEAEGEKAARWLQSNGISAFVLQYRVAGVFAFVTHYRLLGGGNKHPHPIQDAQRAMQHVRENAARYNVNPDRLGIMGFSAGGHLALYAAVKGNHSFLQPLGITTTASLAPSFCAAIYPVVTMSDERYAHKRSRRALLGERHKYDKQLRDALSIEKNVHKDMPPVFLVNCLDDPTVKYQNSELLDAALTEHGVEHRYVQFHSGGHGFGASDKKGTDESRQWRTQFIAWLKQHQNF